MSVLLCSICEGKYTEASLLLRNDSIETRTVWAYIHRGPYEYTSTAMRSYLFVCLFVLGIMTLTKCPNKPTWTYRYRSGLTFCVLKMQCFIAKTNIAPFATKGSLRTLRRRTEPLFKRRFCDLLTQVLFIGLQTIDWVFGRSTWSHYCFMQSSVQCTYPTGCMGCVQYVIRLHA